MKRREFAGHLVGGVAGLAFAAGVPVASIWLEGCNPQSALDQLNVWVPVAIATFDGVLAFINPAAGTVLATLQSTIDGEWKALSGAISTYIHTTPAPTGGMNQIIAFMSALESNITQIVAALPPGLDQKVLTASQAAFALLLATLEDIQMRLTPSQTSAQTTAHTASRTVRATLPAVKPAKSTKDFANRVNAIMAANGQSLRVKQ